MHELKSVCVWERVCVCVILNVRIGEVATVVRIECVCVCVYWMCVCVVTAEGSYAWNRLYVYKVIVVNFSQSWSLCKWRPTLIYYYLYYSNSTHPIFLFTRLKSCFGPFQPVVFYVNCNPVYILYQFTTQIAPPTLLFIILFNLRCQP